MLEMFKQGGIMMYPLVFCSVVALAVIVERLISLRRNKILIPEILAVKEQFSSNEDVSIVRSVCKKFSGPLGNIFIKCLDNRDLQGDDLRATIEDEGRQEVRSLSRGLGVLETIAGVAPLLGLLGTVLGMIEVFNVIESVGVGQAKALSGGIAKALITTATGLFIGIPALVAYNYFNARYESLTLDIEGHVLDLLHRLARMRNPEGEPVNLNLSGS